MRSARRRGGVQERAAGGSMGAMPEGPRHSWTSGFDRRHPRFVVPVRGLVALWLTVAGTVACARRQWWGLALFPFAALHLWLALRVWREAEGSPGAPRQPLSVARARRASRRSSLPRVSR